MSVSLLDVVLRLYSQRKVTQTQADIEKECGIDKQRLKRILNGKAKNPSVQEIQSLYEYLSGKPLMNSVDGV